MRSLALLSCFLGTIACSATTPGVANNDSPDAMPIDPGGGGSVNLQVDSPPPTTPYSSLPLSGKGPANGMVLYDVPVHGQFSKQLGSDGGFCVDVPLEVGADNTIRFQAISAAGEYSDIVTVTTTQSGTAPNPNPNPNPDPGTAGLTNVLAGTSSDNITFREMSVTTGTKEMLVDGDMSAPVEFKDNFGGWTWNALQVKMTKQATVYNIHIRSSDDCKLKNYQVYLSNADVPSSFPGSGQADWWLQQNVTQESSDTTVWPPLAEPTAKWMGIEFSDANCGDWLGGKHRLLELEVNTRDGGGNTVPDPESNPNPTCASGGA